MPFVRARSWRAVPRWSSARARSAILGRASPPGLARSPPRKRSSSEMVLTNEQGLIGGAPAGGVDFGAATNYHGNG